MLKLKSARLEGGTLDTVYEATHSNPGRDGTVLDLDVFVKQIDQIGRIEARVVLNPVVESTSMEDALDKLADWAERLALALRHRGAATNRVPTYDAPEPAPASSAFAATHPTDGDDE